MIKQYEKSTQNGNLIEELKPLETKMIKDFSLFLKILGFILFFVANSVNIQ